MAFPEPRNPNSRHGPSALDELETILWVGVGIGLLAIVASTTRAELAAIGIGVLIFLAAFGTGAFFGFLFGVPRVLSRESVTATTDTSATAGASPTQSSSTLPPPPGETAGAKTSRAKLRLLRSNTNLERISDWLTTMIVGATLVELHKINDALLRFRLFLEDAARVFPTAAGRMSAGVLPTIGPIVLVFGAAAGFLFMYLNTRLVLVRMFDAVERFISGEDKLDATDERAVRALAREEGTPNSFVERQFESKSTLTVEDAITLMFDLLYKGDPGRVIQLGEQLNNTDAVKRPDYWFYLAAAFGQKLQRVQPNTNEWLSARDNALDAARRAVALDPTYRDRLWLISDPDSRDDDLAPLRDDLEFRRIVGR